MSKLPSMQTMRTKIDAYTYDATTLEMIKIPKGTEVVVLEAPRSRYDWMCHVRTPDGKQYFMDYKELIK